jgi:hypothetical protein
MDEEISSESESELESRLAGLQKAMHKQRVPNKKPKPSKQMKGKKRAAEEIHDLEDEDGE